MCSLGSSWNAPKIKKRIKPKMCEGCQTWDDEKGVCDFCTKHCTLVPPNNFYQQK